jgi:hypothetical protein
VAVAGLRRSSVPLGVLCRIHLAAAVVTAPDLRELDLYGHLDTRSVAADMALIEAGRV